MAVVNPDQAAAAARGFGSLPVLRQIGLMVGLAASIAVGVAIVLWSQTPNYQLLYGRLGEQDTAQVMDSLQKAGIDFKLDQTSGALLVPADRLHEARLKLAGEGLPKGMGRFGFELIERQQGFGSSQLMESARYQRALEGELARTISTLAHVKGARVHLALPKQSAFVRNRQAPSASVVLNLYAGRSLDSEQIAGIVHLVASSVPALTPKQVSVIDQKGRLLNGREESEVLGLTRGQFELTRQIESTYIKRIEDILAPLVGAGRVRAQVVADMDYTLTEETAEDFNDDKPALRSAQTSEEENTGGTAALGIPGALSNQPPAPAVTAPAAGDGTPADGQAAAAPANAKAAETPRSKRRQATQNYELDKTIRHVRKLPGKLRRLSVAVVVDHKQVTDAKGRTRSEPYSQEEIDRFTTLVKDAVGFDEGRGDRVSVVNASFSVPAAPEPLPDPPLWEQPWVWNLAKQLGGVALVLALVFGVLKPVLKRLAEKGEGEPAVTFAGAPQAQLPPGEGVPGLPPGTAAGPDPYETGLASAKQLAAEDPKRVAQVIKGWVAQDA